MKKVFVYLTIFILIFVIQACNPTSTDSKESTSKETTKKKNAFSIAASEVPSSVINTFNSKYPKAADVTWEKQQKMASLRIKQNGK
jgi:curli biogenesis system outer membrane secretion channel CsgG